MVRAVVQAGQGTGKVPHWAGPDVLGDILAAARRPGVADPVEIRIRPELHARLVQQLSADGLLVHGAPAELDGVSLVVDPRLPLLPGYEIHRASPDHPLRHHGPDPRRSGDLPLDEAR